MVHSNAPIKKIAITAGEPAGIGPDLILTLAEQPYPHALIICASKSLLAERAELLGKTVKLIDYDPSQPTQPHQIGQLLVCDEALATPAKAGKLDPRNGQYVLNTLRRAAQGCMNQEFAAVVTGPVHKGVINDAGVEFSGHTEFFAELSNTEQVVMMLATEGLRVALATTHIPLSQVASAITQPKLKDVIRILHQDLQQKFAIAHPKILVCGLNPHAGENGCLGHEEIEVISPVLDALRQEGMDLEGPLPADTLFQEKYLKTADAVLAMYHDQGLPVLKFKGFGQSVNITLGLPFLRTSVDHGTALDLAGTGTAHTGSLRTALSHAIALVDKQS